MSSGLRSQHNRILRWKVSKKAGTCGIEPLLINEMENRGFIAAQDELADAGCVIMAGVLSPERGCARP